MPQKRQSDLQREDDRPWDENRWRGFLRESDLRAARYAELFETLLDDPHRDLKIAREMGWSDGSASDERGPGYAADCEGASDEVGLDEIDPNDPELLAEVEADRRSLNAIPAYRWGRTLASLVIKTLTPFNDVNDDRIAVACEHALTPSAKIAAGHGIGYDDDAICGNIVCNTMALSAARKAHVEFSELKADGVLPTAETDKILKRLDDLATAIEARIAELRARVTW
ncbi:MAG TPA: hypothetical protein VGN72_00740 [Tepidisphaeraceae bacterium]|jgi:hypothetical protein|nr:hypothetical protein [Tepidisphaeraceae bacterium]